MNTLRLHALLGRSHYSISALIAIIEELRPMSMIEHRDLLHSLEDEMSRFDVKDTKIVALTNVTSWRALEARLEKIAVEIETGCGLSRERELDEERYDIEETMAVEFRTLLDQ